MSPLSLYCNKFRIDFSLSIEFKTPQLQSLSSLINIFSTFYKYKFFSLFSIKIEIFNSKSTFFI